jgi:hypothetical protein
VSAALEGKQYRKLSRGRVVGDGGRAGAAPISRISSLVSDGGYLSTFVSFRHSFGGTQRVVNIYKYESIMFLF